MPLPGSGFVQISQNLRMLNDRINLLIDTVSNVKDMSPAVRGMAFVWRKNYNGQGTAGYVDPHWKQLAERTQQVRRQRGYDATYPRLVQAGNLKRAAIDIPAGFKGRTLSATTPRSPHKHSSRGHTAVRITTQKNRAKLTITGDKVIHNAGGLMYGKIPVPARKFWFVSPIVEKHAARMLEESLQKVVKETMER